MIERVCIQWPRFGPYHLARLIASHRVFAREGVEMIGLETASTDLYAWPVENGPVPFRREQVFPGRTFEDIPPREMEAAVVAALDRLQPDAVAIMSYGYPDGRAALGWCRRHRRVAVNMTDSKADDGPRVAWREWVKRRIVAQYDAALVSGTPQRRYLEALGLQTGQITDGYNVVDNDRYARIAADVRRNPAPWRHLPGFADPTPAFVAVGRMLPLKNIDGLVRAYAAYRWQTDTPWRLLLVGDGPDRDRIERIVAEEAIEGVTVCGFRTADEVAAYLGRANALVHPSHKDTWGLVVNEAMAAGLPVVVSRQSGCWMDLVDEGRNGFTFPSDDLTLLTRHLLSISASDTDRTAMGARSQEIVARYTPTFFAEQLLAAVRLGESRADRRTDPLARALLWAVRATSTSVTAHHGTQV